MQVQKKQIELNELIDGLNKNDIVSNLNELDGKLKSFF